MRNCSTKIRFLRQLKINLPKPNFCQNINSSVLNEILTMFFSKKYFWRQSLFLIFLYQISFIQTLKNWNSWLIFCEHRWYIDTHTPSLFHLHISNMRMLLCLKNRYALLTDHIIFFMSNKLVTIYVIKSNNGTI